MRAIILFAPGTNCEEETEVALKKTGFKTRILTLKELLNKPENLLKSNLFVIPGGFSFGDYIKSGKVLGYYLREKLWNVVESFYKKGGVILGICNGFQVLLRSGILPFMDRKVHAYLIRNSGLKFEDRWVFLKGEKESYFSNNLEYPFPIPIAHAEGRFVADSKTLKLIKKYKLVVFRYCDENGELKQEYPINPNGSVDNIAGIRDPQDRILGLMPHPERAFVGYQLPGTLKRFSPPGKIFFENILRKCLEKSSGIR